MIKLIILSFLYFLGACSTSTSVAGGGGTGTGNPYVSGIVFMPDSSVVPNAKITVRRIDENPSSRNLNYLGEEFNSLGIISTDSLGCYSFSLLDTGIFLIDIETENRYSYSTPLVIDNNDDTLDISGSYLTTDDTITGRVELLGGDSSASIVYLYGTERSGETDSLGNFSIIAPSGIYQILVVPISTQYSSYSTEPKPSQGDMGVIKILAITPTSTSYSCDSLIVRNILDSNNLSNIEVKHVTRAENGRIVELDFAADVQDTFMINVSGYIKTMPSIIGGLSALEELEIQFTQLQSIPSEISRLVNLEELELNNNRFTSLPNTLANLNPKDQLDLHYNYLKNLSAELTAWADKYDPTWKDYQK